MPFLSLSVAITSCSFLSSDKLIERLGDLLAHLSQDNIVCRGSILSVPESSSRLWIGLIGQSDGR